MLDEFATMIHWITKSKIQQKYFILFIHDSDPVNQVANNLWALCLSEVSSLKGLTVFDPTKSHQYEWEPIQYRHD